MLIIRLLKLIIESKMDKKFIFGWVIFVMFLSEVMVKIKVIIKNGIKS